MAENNTEAVGERFMFLGDPWVVLALKRCSYGAFFTKKHTKNLGCRTRQSALALFTSRKRHSSVASCLAARRLSQVLGAGVTRCAQTSSRLFRALLDLLSVPRHAAFALSAPNYYCDALMRTDEKPRSLLFYEASLTRHSTSKLALCSRLLVALRLRRRVTIAML